MSDILIKNMDMPKDCVICPLCRILFDEFNCRATGEWFEIDDKVHRRDDCPLVEVPKHGRLIDADALPINDEWSLVGTDVVWDAPTVLEATDGHID